MQSALSGEAHVIQVLGRKGQAAERTTFRSLKIDASRQEGIASARTHVRVGACQNILFTSSSAKLT